MSTGENEWGLLSLRWAFMKIHCRPTVLVVSFVLAIVSRTSQAYDCLAQTSLHSYASPSGRVTVGTNVEYTCKKGYIFPDGSSKLHATCIRIGWWDYIVPSCIPLTCSVQKVANAHTSEKKEKVPRGTVVTYWCVIGYTFPDGSMEKSTKCMLNKEWNSTLPSCIDTSCKMPTLKNVQPLPVKRIGKGFMITLHTKFPYFFSVASTELSRTCIGGNEWDGPLADGIERPHKVLIKQHGKFMQNRQKVKFTCTASVDQNRVVGTSILFEHIRHNKGTRLTGTTTMKNGFVEMAVIYTMLSRYEGDRFRCTVITKTDVGSISRSYLTRVIEQEVGTHTGDLFVMRSANRRNASRTSRAPSHVTTSIALVVAWLHLKARQHTRT